MNSIAEAEDTASVNKAASVASDKGQEPSVTLGGGSGDIGKPLQEDLVSCDSVNFVVLLRFRIFSLFH